LLSRILKIKSALHGLEKPRKNVACEMPVSCQKGKPIREAKPGDWRCKECGFVTSKKKKICEPKKVKK
jgi:hypothetical protein